MIKDKPKEPEKKPEETSNKPKELELTELEKAQKVVKEQKEANAELRELIERQEKLEANKVLGGRSEAGQAPAEKKELTPKEYKDQVMAGKVPPKEE